MGPFYSWGNWDINLTIRNHQGPHVTSGPLAKPLLPGAKPQVALTSSHCLCRTVLRTYYVSISCGRWRIVRDRSSPPGPRSWWGGRAKRDISEGGQGLDDNCLLYKVLMHARCSLREAFGQSSWQSDGRCEYYPSLIAWSLTPQNLQGISTQAAWFQSAGESHRAWLALESCCLGPCLLLPLISCVCLGKLPPLSEPPFPGLKTE